MKTSEIGFLATLMLLVGSGADDPRSIIIEVDAGAHDRRDTLVQFTLPKDRKEMFKFSVLESLVENKLCDGQRDDDIISWSLTDPLPAGAKRRYRLTPQPAPVDNRPQSPNLIRSTFGLQMPRSLIFAGNPDVQVLNLNDRPILGYQKAVAVPPRGIDPVFRRSGFIHPLATRSGLVVTDDFPPDHAHQHGVFFAWVNTTFDGRHVDFWNQKEGTGRVRHASGDDGPTYGSGPVAASLHAILQHDDLTTPGGPEKVLNETWRMVVHDVPGLVVVDFESDQECAGSKPLKINKYHYGGFGLRANRQWFDPTAKENDPPDPARSGRSDFLTSEGKHRGDGNYTRPRWVDLSGMVDGRVGGVTVLDHPGNFRFPQPIRLHPNKPYFCFAPMVLGEFELEPGKPYVSRYRLIVHDGPPDPKVIERLWDDYADPPRVRIVSVGL
jgi:hypothetical protein